MAYRAGVVGGSGYTGAELLRLLAGHPEIEVVHTTADANVGAAVGELYPGLLAAYEHLRYSPLVATDLTGLDLVFCLLPHGASQVLLPDLLDHVGHAVDLGADFRLAADVYARWNTEPHRAPELIDRFAYGLVELYRDEIATRAHVAAPGCHATAISLACAPLLALDLVEPRIVADSVSGVSGAGRGLKTTSLFSEANENISAYGLLTHFHTAEMEQTLTKVARQSVSVLFTPHLVPVTRGILATCYARPATSGLSTARLLEHYRDFYANDPCVFVVDEPSGTKATYGANVAHLTVRFDARTDTVVAIAAEDNLVKGASGQMVQAANLLLGLPETTALPLLGIQP
jgi:N-acetyl-gamma-glutamyl-phosphate reductase